MTGNVNTIIIATFSVLFSLLSLVVSFLIYLIRRREPWVQSLIKIMDRLEKDEIRDIRRKIVYKINRDSQGDWIAPGYTSEQTKDGLDRWGVEMDLLALLYFSKQFSTAEFFEIYGDVVLRTAYQLAPYANQQRMERGEQFWLPFQKFTLALLGLWIDYSNKGLYPGRIGIPGGSNKVSPTDFQNDTHMRTFLQANSLRVKHSKVA